MATLAIINHQLDKFGVYDSFWAFVLSNETGVIGTAAGVTLGIATAALTYVIAVGFLVPLLALTTTAPIGIFNKRLSTRLTTALFGNAKQEFGWARIWHFSLMWILVVIMVFVVLEGLRRLAKRLASKKQEQQQKLTF
jgi:large-conductance mechanosensitive channel